MYVDSIILTVNFTSWFKNLFQNGSSADEWPICGVEGALWTLFRLEIDTFSIINALMETIGGCLG